MRDDWKHLEKFRIQLHRYVSEAGDHFGVFVFPYDDRIWLACIATDGADCPGANQHTIGWEHVSIHGENERKGTMRHFTPDWDMMAFIKQKFWKDSEAVVQFHVPLVDHVNVHPNTLHLWRNRNDPPKLPPKICV